MSEPEKPAEQRLAALYRYISALEQGDIETLAAVLNEASADPVLNALLEEADAVYQATDGIAVSELEARRAVHGILASAQNGNLTRDQQAIFLQPAIAQQHQRNKETVMEEQATLPLPNIQNQPRQPMHRRQRGRKLQLLAALLAVCALVGATAALISLRHTGSQSGSLSHATPAGAKPPHSIVVVRTGVNNLFYGLRPDNGKRIWSFTAPKVQEGVSSGSDILIQGQSVYLLVNSQIYALRATDGKLLWHTSLFLKGTQQDSYSTFLYDRGLLYVSGDVFGSEPIPQGKLFVLRASDGSIAWHYENYDSPLFTVHNGIAYVITDNNTITSHLRALRGSDGKQLWVRDGLPISVVADDATAYVYFAHPITAGDPGMHKDEKTIVALNAQNGEQRWAIPLTSNGADQLQLDHNQLFFSVESSNDAQICSLQAKNGQQIWCHSFTTRFGGALLGDTVNYLATNNMLYIFSTQRTFAGTETAIVQGTVVSRPKEHQKTVIQVYSETDGTTQSWGTVLNDWSTYSAALQQNTLFISTYRYVWALDSHGQVLWKYANPLPGDSDIQFLEDAFNTLAAGSW